MHRIFIMSGIILFIIFYIITWIFNIPTVNNFASIIGSLLVTPIFMGLYLYGEKIKEYKFKLSILLRGFSAFSIFAIIISNIIVLVGL